MKQISLKSIALYAALTALSIVMLMTFARFIADHDQYVILGLLIFGATSASAVAIYLGMRWYWDHFKEDVTDKLQKPATHLLKLAENPDKPLSVRDVLALRDDFDWVWELGQKVLKAFLALLLVMGVSISLLTLAAAAVAYLQVKRLEEQNTLLDQQNRTQIAAFLTASVSSIEAIDAAILNSTKTSDALSEDGLAAPFSILDEFMSGSGLTPSPIIVENFVPEVCRDGDATSCEGINTDAFFEIGSKGGIEVTEQNIEAVRGYIRLAGAAERAFIGFVTSVEGAPDSVGEANEFVLRTLLASERQCGVNPENSLADLWLGIGGLGFASVEMFSLQPDEVAPGTRLDASEVQDRVNFGSYAASLGIIRQALGENVDGPLATPQDAADLFGRGLLALQSGIEGHSKNCAQNALRLAQTAAVLQKERVYQTKQLELLELAREDLNKQ